MEKGSASHNFKRKSQFLVWQKSRKRKDWVEYKNVCKTAKKAVSKAK